MQARMRTQASIQARTSSNTNTALSFTTSDCVYRSFSIRPGVPTPITGLWCFSDQRWREGLAPPISCCTLLRA